ncbi:MAG: GAF domain-containing protein [Nitrospirota bacterium]
MRAALAGACQDQGRDHTDPGEADLVQLDGPPMVDDALSVLQALSATVCRAPEVEGALNGLLDRLLSLTGADTGAIHLVREETEELRLVARRGLSERFWQLECRIPKGACLCGRAVYGDEPLVVNDLARDQRLERPACLDERIGSLVAVPLHSQGRTFGLLTLYAERSGAFVAVDRSLLRAIGLHVGAGIDNAAWGRHIRELAVAHERRVIAAELHDGVAQSLAYLNLKVRRVQDLAARGGSDGVSRELEAVQCVVQRTYEDVRHLLADFRMTPIEPGSFCSALEQQVREFQHRTGIRTELSGAHEAAALSFGQQTEVFRIAQEALANVRKHACASSVVVSCERADGWWRLRVTDDGTGFDPSRADDSSGQHIGTSIMRERAARLRGHVAIESQPGRGTTVTVSVPLMRDEERSTP